MTNLKDKLKYFGRIVAKASLVAGVGLSVLFGTGYCARQCANGFPDIENSIQKLYSPKFNIQKDKDNKYGQLKKENQYEAGLLKQKNEYELEMSRQRVQHRLDEIKTHELELRNKRKY